MAKVGGAMGVDADGRTAKIIWGGLRNGDEGKPVEASLFPTKSVQITGNPGTGGTIVIEGSNDDVNYVTLSDALGNSLSMTAAGSKLILENMKYMRPRVTAGDTTTMFNVNIEAVR